MQQDMLNALLFLLLAVMDEAPAQPADMSADVGERQEIYDSLLSCSAFHTIEASRGDDLARAAQKASAEDYAKAATLFAPDGKAATADRDLGTLLQRFRLQLDGGEPQAMAEQWTALERSCAELHPLKERLMQRARAEAASAPIEGER